MFAPSALDFILVVLLLLIHWIALVLAFMLFRSTAAILRVLITVSTTVALAFMGWQWNGWAGAFFLPFLGHLFFWSSIILVSSSLFPTLRLGIRRQAVMVLLSYIFGFHRNSYVIERGKADLRVPGAIKNGEADLRVPGRQLSRYGSGVIMVGVGQAAVLETSTQFSRVIGPGVEFTRRLEKIKTVVDLRSQSRGAEVSARTRDGVPVQTSVFGLFRIAPEGKRQDQDSDFPFHRQTIQKVIYRQDGLAEEDERHSWDDYAIRVVVSRFQEILSRFTLDQLFAPHDPDQVPRLVLASLLETAVRNDLSRRDIELIFVNFGALELPDEVQEQRIASWQAEWKARAKEKEAVGEADAERSVQAARAAGQWELVQGLINGLSASQGLSGIEPADLVTWHLLNAVESMSADPLLQPLIPQETVNTLLDIREWLEAP